MSYAQVRRKLPLSSLVLRLVLVAFIVFATINPSKYTVTTWILVSPAPLSVRLLVAFSLAAVWVFILRVAYQGLRSVGYFLVFLIFVCLGLLDYQFEFLSKLDGPAFTLAMLIVLIVVLTLGLIGSYLVRGFTGQSPVVKHPP